MSLSKVISDASRQFKNDVGGVKKTVNNSAQAALNQTKSDIKGVIPGVRRQAQAYVTGGVSDVLNQGKNTISTATNRLMHGDISGALGALSEGPGKIIGSLSKTFGLSNMSTLNNSSGPALGDALAGALARADPMLSYQWYCVMPDVTPLGGSPVTLPWYYVEEAAAPFRQLNTRTIFFEGRQKKFPDNYSIDNLRLTLYADTAGVSLRYVQAWGSAILTPTTVSSATFNGGGYGRSKDYKKTITIYLLDAARAQLARLEYVECWPIGLDAYTLDSGSSTRILNQIQFSVGDVFITLYDIKDAYENPQFRRAAAAAIDFPIAQTNIGVPALPLPNYS